MDFQHAAASAVAFDRFEILASQDAVEEAAALCAARIGARIRWQGGRWWRGGRRQQTTIDLRIADEEHAEAKEIRRDRDICQIARQEAHLRGHCSKRQRGGNMHLRYDKVAVGAKGEWCRCGA